MTVFVQQEPLPSNPHAQQEQKDREAIERDGGLTATHFDVLYSTRDCPRGMKRNDYAERTYNVSPELFTIVRRELIERGLLTQYGDLTLEGRHVL